MINGGKNSLVEPARFRGAVLNAKMKQKSPQEVGTVLA